MPVAEVPRRQGAGRRLVRREVRRGRRGATEGENNSLRQGQGPWKDPATVEGILAHPKAKPQPWVQGGHAAHIEYCIENFGQFPVTYNPMQMHFGVVVHHLDTDFYDQYYKAGYITDRHRDHEHNWH